MVVRRGCHVVTKVPLDMGEEDLRLMVIGVQGLEATKWSPSATTHSRRRAWPKSLDCHLIVIDSLNPRPASWQGCTRPRADEPIGQRKGVNR